MSEIALFLIERRRKQIEAEMIASFNQRCLDLERRVSESNAREISESGETKRPAGFTLRFLFEKRRKILLESLSTNLQVLGKEVNILMTRLKNRPPMTALDVIGEDGQLRSDLGGPVKFTSPPIRRRSSLFSVTVVDPTVLPISDSQQPVVLGV